MSDEWTNVTRNLIIIGFTSSRSVTDQTEATKKETLATLSQLQTGNSCNIDTKSLASPRA